ncbi:ABC transporter ATP-binding protein [Pseudanabaena mucicola]|uniref:ABC transporter ATP-binding protein n=1 Tax=Pseudanabaena mucicola FACHB-723 TaxID=2692860 RepID=A0ABR8A002_9CYAN|nr:ABC transporter ATP-binding protein [Pseudanabaena mucicola]MBD2189487.1 ABC transporter ATP-binding protein [Pseudanabaena mucicola FACHB-723]
MSQSPALAQDLAQPENLLLSVRNLQVAFRGDEGIVHAVKNISFDLAQGQTLGIVGESGSGKSATALAIMGLLGESGKITNGEVLFRPSGEVPLDLVRVSPQKMLKYRGDRMAMIFQEPMTSLNPLFTCGYQVIEAIRLHQQVSQQEAEIRTIQLFQEVQLPNPEQLIERYPHELSGGQLQRVMIAMAISCNPQLIIADEPTTALDVTVQATILQLLKEIQRSRQMSMIFITHDLGILAEIADQALVMNQGEVVESGATTAIFRTPQHPYTKGLIACRPQPDRQLRLLPTVSDFMEMQNGQLVEKEPSDPRYLEVVLPEETAARLSELQKQAPILSVQNLRIEFPIRSILGFKKRHFVAVNNISFDVYRGETLGLVGESGCGKTTTGRAILGLTNGVSGSVKFEGTEISQLKGEALQKLRCDLQVVFQDPYGSLNPRMSVGDAIAEPLIVHSHQERFHRYRKAEARKERVAYLLERVGLTKSAMRRYPHEFSGGQRQRICIARALALNPKLIIADEPVSALDVSVQAQVLNLLKELQAEFGLTYIFISHDLGVVKFMSDRIMVMNRGEVVELGTAESIYTNPQQPYTQRLISAIPKSLVLH